VRLVEVPPERAVGDRLERDDLQNRREQARREVRDEPLQS
jgi:hypothetical protein